MIMRSLSDLGIVEVVNSDRYSRLSNWLIFKFTYLPTPITDPMLKFLHASCSIAIHFPNLCKILFRLSNS